MNIKNTFPDPSNANEDGLLAVGGDLSVFTLIEAYSKGIFPWFDDTSPILWWSPDPRFILTPEQLKKWDFDFIDAQVPSDHMKRLGAKEIQRDAFLKILKESLEKPTRKGKWGEELREEV